MFGKVTSNIYGYGRHWDSIYVFHFGSFILGFKIPANDSWFSDMLLEVSVIKNVATPINGDCTFISGFTDLNNLIQIFHSSGNLMKM